MSASHFRRYCEFLATRPDFYFKFSPQPSTSRFRLPGFDWSITSEGVNIPAVMMHMIYTNAFSRWYTEKIHTKSTYFPKVRGKNLGFIVSCSMNFSGALYQKKCEKNPLDATVTLGHVGKSSFSKLVELYTPERNHEPPVKMVLTQVYVDHVTRKTAPFPEWFRKAMEDECSLTEPTRMERFSRPPNTFVHRMEVFHSHTDTNNHTNFTSYAKFAIDAIYSALRVSMASETESESIRDVSSFNSIPDKNPVTRTKVKETSEGLPRCDVPQQSKDQVKIQTLSSNATLVGPHLGESLTFRDNPIKWLSKEMVETGIKSLDILFLNESVEGDILDVHVWQEEKEPFVVKTFIEKDGVPLTQLKIGYHGPEHKL